MHKPLLVTDFLDRARRHYADETAIVATTGETLVLEAASFEEQLRDSEDPADFRRVLETMREEVVPDLLEPLGLNT